MVIIDITKDFEKKLNKLKKISFIEKQINKIIVNPEVGKPMKYFRRGTREVYFSPFRISYAWIEKENKIILLDIYHKDNQ